MHCILKRDNDKYWIAHFKDDKNHVQTRVGLPTDDAPHAIAHISRHWDLCSLEIHKDDGTVTTYVRRAIS